jgi:acetyl-CoA C-acetyltransferase
MIESTLGGSAAIVGAYEHPLRHAPDKSEWLMQAESIVGALDDAGLEKSDVDAFFTVAPSPEGGYVRESAASMLCDYLNLQPKFVDETDIGGAAFNLFLNRAALAIHAGLIEVAVIGYGACTRSQGIKVGTRNFAEIMNRPPMPFPDAFMEPFGTTIIGYIGMLMQRFMHDHGTTPEQFASVAVSARKHAATNPDAVMRRPLTVDDVLSSPVIATPVHRLDCCIITDGGGALVVTTPDRAQSLRKPPIWVRGFGEGIINSRGGHSDWIADFYDMMGAASDRAYQMAGITPADVDFAELYDAFTIATLQGLEATRLCKPGEAGPFVEAGGIDPGGELPVNPDGGGLCSNHPGRRGLFLLIDAVRQLRGEAVGWQVPDPTNALISATGSAYMGVQGSAVTILSKER